MEEARLHNVDDMDALGTNGQLTILLFCPLFRLKFSKIHPKKGRRMSAVTTAKNTIPGRSDNNKSIARCIHTCFSTVVMSSSLASKKKKIAALARFKAAKSGVAAHRSALDDLEDGTDGHLGNDDGDDDDRIYDIYSEDEYRKLVQTRREQEDFVVDDDGLGYYDDGEEHCWDGDDDERGGGKKGGGNRNNNNTLTAALTSKALSKARKAAQSTYKAASVLPHNQNNNNNRSMWDFVNKGHSVGEGGGGSLTAAGAGKNRGKTNNASLSRSSQAAATGNSAARLDDLLSELDDAVAYALPSKRSMPSHGPSSRPVRRPRHAPPPPHPTRSSSSSSELRKPYRPHNDSTPPDNNYYDNDNDNDQPVFDDVDDNYNGGVGTPSKPTAAEETTTGGESGKSVRFASPMEQPSSSSSLTKEEEGVVSNAAKEHPTAEPNDAVSSTQPQPPTRRRVLARPKLQPAAPPPPPTAAATTAASSEGGSVAAASKSTSAARHLAATSNFALDLVSSSSSSSDATATAPSTGAGGGGTTAGQIDLALLLKQQEPENLVPPADDDASSSSPAAETSTATPTATTSTPYLDMFWTDIAERQGDILLFGKVPYQNSFVSTCCVVRGCVRNLYVLPRDNSTLQQVHSELSKTIMPKLLPQKAGVSWGGKPVERHYAFDDPDLPQKAQYLKVVYSSQYPVPSPDVCQNGGQHFAKILQATVSPIETFLVNCRLKGPGWIRLTAPSSRPSPLSWCKVECQVDSPKQVRPLVGGTNVVVPPPPPLVTVTLQFQTTHATSAPSASGATGHTKTEIVSIAAVCHQRVHLEGTTASQDNNHHHQQHLCLIRPLAGSSFPRDLDKALPKQQMLRKEVNERALLSRLLAQIGQVRVEFLRPTTAFPPQTSLFFVALTPPLLLYLFSILPPLVRSLVSSPVRPCSGIPT